MRGLLSPGATVFLTAPASPVTEEQARQGVAALEHLGFSVQTGQSLSESCRGYAAGTPQARGAELNRAFADPAVDAVWCARGGYTAASVLPFLDYPRISCHPKPFIGYSDITALHAALNQYSGLVTWHGPMACSDLAARPEPGTLDCLGEMLMSGGVRLYRNPDGSSLQVLRPGRAEGITVGGNLTVFCSLLGTRWMPETAGRILFLEEVDEPVPAVERLLVQLERAGVFYRAAGVLLGCFTRCENRYCAQYDVNALLRDFFSRFPIPVTGGLECGHCSPTGTLPLGGLCRMDEGQIQFFPANSPPAIQPMEGKYSERDDYLS